MVEWSDITAAVALALGGDRVAGRRDLLRCWRAVVNRPDTAAQRCVLAHYLADLEEDLADEVRWDERALRAYAGVQAGDLGAIGIVDAAALAPSLHLNLGDGYRRQGRLEAARREVDAGIAAASALEDDGYGAMVRSGLERLSVRLPASAAPVRVVTRPVDPPG